jgi:hypothetical protein
MLPKESPKQKRGKSKNVIDKFKILKISLLKKFSLMFPEDKDNAELLKELNSKMKELFESGKGVDIKTLVSLRKSYFGISSPKKCKTH